MTANAKTCTATPTNLKSPSPRPLSRRRKDGMVMDFTDLKAIVKQHITDPFDHAFIYHGNNERESQIAALLEGWNMKTCACPAVPQPKT